MDSALKHIRQTMSECFTGYPTEVKFYDQIYGQLYQKETNQQKIITWFSLLAILISLVGVFGLIILKPHTAVRKSEYEKYMEPPRDKFFGCSAAPTSRFPSSVHSWPVPSPGMPYRNG